MFWKLRLQGGLDIDHNGWGGSERGMAGFLDVHPGTKRTVVNRAAVELRVLEDFPMGEINLLY